MKRRKEKEGRGEMGKGKKGKYGKDKGKEGSVDYHAPNFTQSAQCIAPAGRKPSKQSGEKSAI